MASERLPRSPARAVTAMALGANVKFIDGMDLPERFALGISGNGPRSFAMAGPVHREILDGGILLHAVVRVK